MTVILRWSTESQPDQSYRDINYCPHDLDQRATQPLAPWQVASEFSKKRQWGKLKIRPWLAPPSKLCFGQTPISSLYNGVVGQVEVPAGQVNFMPGKAYPAQKIMFCNLFVAPCTFIFKWKKVALVRGKYSRFTVNTMKPNENCTKPKTYTKAHMSTKLNSIECVDFNAA